MILTLRAMNYFTWRKEIFLKKSRRLVARYGSKDGCNALWKSPFRVIFRGCQVYDIINVAPDSRRCIDSWRFTKYVGGLYLQRFGCK